MATVPYKNQPTSNLPVSLNNARHDDFFGYSNPVQAINAIVPRNNDNSIQQPTQVISVSAGTIPPDMIFESAGGSFFDMRSPSEIFADMDTRLNRQRQTILNSPQVLKMLQQRPNV